MKKKNAGFTIVELIVVVAMLSIFIGIFVVNVGRITGYNAKECYKKISSAITENKIETLSKAKETGDIYLQIYQDTLKDRIYVRTVRNGKSASKEYTDETKLTKRSGVTVKYELKNGGSVTTKTATKNHPLNICFNRASGALVDPDDSYKVSKLQKIIISSGGYQYSIDIVPATGKVKGK